jgi:DNA topoisomerase I
MPKTGSPDLKRRKISPSAAARLVSTAGLKYVSDRQPGITRVRRGKKFGYLGVNGKPIDDPRQLQRIARLAIPPAYSDVWICTYSRGHLQATGRDARGRKQYRYHAAWRESRDCAKFERLLEFGAALPKLRRQLKTHLALPGLQRDKVLAVVVSLLDATKIRVGNAEYARANGSFGLTTLRDRHCKFLREGRALLRFRGKGGVQHEVLIDDRRLARIVHRCQELPGQHLFQFIDDNGRRHAVNSSHVNEYLHRALGQRFTAKDFRTWNATRMAVELLRSIPCPQHGKSHHRAYKTGMLQVIRQVASELRNTPAICRKSYINPLVFAAWRDGNLHRLLSGCKARTRIGKERAVLRLLSRYGNGRLAVGEK